MPDYPRVCPGCHVLTEESGFARDRSKTSGHRSYCRDCDRQRARAYYAAHRDELYAQREAAREKAWREKLEALEKEHRKKVAARSGCTGPRFVTRRSFYARSACRI
jgi:hypothetical protein